MITSNKITKIIEHLEGSNYGRVTMPTTNGIHELILEASKEKPLILYDLVDDLSRFNVKIKNFWVLNNKHITFELS